MINKNIGDGMLKAYARMLADMSHQDLEVVVSGDRAYSTTSKIVIPSLPINNAKALAMATGYAMHEEGHINATDFAIWPTDPLLAKVSNWFEDIRIEARQMRRFLGARTRLASLMRHMIEDGLFSKPTPDFSPAKRLSAYVLYRLRADVLDQKAFELYANEAEELTREAFPPGAMARLAAMMFKIEDATSTQDSIDLAASILSMLQEEEEKANQEEQAKSPPDESQPEPEKRSDTEDEQTNAQSDENSDDDEGNADSSGESKEDPDASGSFGEADDEVNGAGDDVTAPATSSDEDKGFPSKNLTKVLSGEDELSNGDLGEILEHALNQLHEQNEATAIEIPPSEMYRGSVGDPAQIVGRIDNATKALKRRVSNLLEGVDREKRYNTSSGSRLDTRRMMGVARGETRVFMKRIDGVQMNTVVQILIDRSYSMDMGHRIVFAAEAALALSSSLEGVQGLQSSVAAFPTTIGHSSNGIAIVSDFGERTAHAATRFAALSAEGFTPMGEALLWSGCRLMNRREDRKILFVITDGQPEAENELSTVSRAKARTMVDELEKNGIEVIALGIKIDVSLLFGTSRKVEELGELPSAVFEMIQAKLLGQRAA